MISYMYYVYKNAFRLEKEALKHCKTIIAANLSVRATVPISDYKKRFEVEIDSCLASAIIYEQLGIHKTVVSK